MCTHHPAPGSSVAAPPTKKYHGFLLRKNCSAGSAAARQRSASGSRLSESTAITARHRAPATPAIRRQSLRWQDGHQALARVAITDWLLHERHVAARTGEAGQKEEPQGPEHLPDRPLDGCCSRCGRRHVRRRCGRQWHAQGLGLRLRRRGRMRREHRAAVRRLLALCDDLRLCHVISSSPFVCARSVARRASRVRRSCCGPAVRLPAARPTCAFYICKSSAVQARSAFRHNHRQRV